MQEYIKSNIPEEIIKYIKIIRLKFNYWKIQSISVVNQSLLTLVVKSRFLSSLYYILYSNAFTREQQGVIYGILKNLEEQESINESQYLLRRNIHRIEKGILMRPRRNMFAENYIEKTVECYEKAVLKQQSINPDQGELLWAHDVLNQYFEIVTSNPQIEQLKNKFISLEHLLQNYQDYLRDSQNDNIRVPYRRNLSHPSSVSYDNLLKLAYRRRSVRWYLRKPVPRHLIDQAIAIAALSPSACNRQPFEFRIYDQPELVEKVSSIPMGTKGFSHNFPVVAVLVGKLRAYVSERDRHVIYIDGALSAMSFMYALETLGLSSCPINWPDIESLERKMATLVGLEPDERVVMLISLGYPDPEGMVAYSQKKSLDQLRRYN